MLPDALPTAMAHKRRHQFMPPPAQALAMAQRLHSVYAPARPPGHREHVSPQRLLDSCGADALRWYLLRDIQFGDDGDIQQQRLLDLVNNDLANTNNEMEISENASNTVDNASSIDLKNLIKQEFSQTN
jgi:hypothetical protein